MQVRTEKSWKWTGNSSPASVPGLAGPSVSSPPASAEEGFRYRTYKWILGGLALLLAAAVLLSACVGAMQISYADLVQIIGHELGLAAPSPALQKGPVLLIIRLPRIVLGVLVGASLGISGAALQGLFRNPLAEPGLIGISSGAALFATAMIVLEGSFLKGFRELTGYYGLMLAAFGGACLCAWLVYRLAVSQGRALVAMLLLSGIAINALSGSFTGIFTYLSTNEQLRSITFWMLGSLGGASWEMVIALLPFTLVPLVAIPMLGKSLNAFTLGEQQAYHLGVNTGRVKKMVLVLATMSVGASVAVSGVIGFVGLVIPHILRMCFGADHRLVLPGSALLGGIVLVLSDLVSRTVVAPAELPIGILTAIIGCPVFIYIIMREGKKNYL